MLRILHAYFIREHTWPFLLALTVINAFFILNLLFRELGKFLSGFNNWPYHCPNGSTQHIEGADKYQHFASESSPFHGHGARLGGTFSLGRFQHSEASC